MLTIRQQQIQQLFQRIHAARRKKLCAAILAFILALQQIERSPKRAIWTHHWIGRREILGAHHNLFLELRNEDPDKYRKCLRMTPQMFDWLVLKVAPLIKKQDTHLRKSIPPEERLSLTLRHLATGESQESLSMLFRIGQSTISGIIKETCKAISSVLKDTYLRFPSTEAEWKVIAAEYQERWNFPHCMGAMDGKHVVIAPPLKSGSLYYNYKDTFSIVLLAVVDAELRIIFADVGTNGRVADRGVWNKCSLKQCLEENSINIPKPNFLPGTQTVFPYVIVGDEGFTLSKHVLIPYPKEQLAGRNDRRIFNYRLSRARRCSENVFGIMANRFQILRSPMRYDPDDARDIVLAILCLHNLLRSDSINRGLYSPPQMMDHEDELTGQMQLGEWRQEPAPVGLVRLANQGGNRHANDALHLRNELCGYFNGVGAVPWQERMIRAGNM